MNISTIKELEDWMAENCMKNKITPGNRFETDDGVGLEKYENLYIWYHSELGEKENLIYFNTEKEAVEFIYGYVRKDKYANSHLVGNFKDQNLKNEIIAELKNRNIQYWNDEIWYSPNEKHMRFFVYRCDIKKVADLKEKYLIA
jgi:hypothetical protein